MDIKFVLVLVCVVAFASCRKDEAGNKGVTVAANSTKAKHESGNKTGTTVGISARLIGIPPIDAEFNNRNKTGIHTPWKISNLTAQSRWKNHKPKWLLKNRCCKCEDTKDTTEVTKQPMKETKTPNNATTATTTSRKVDSKVSPVPNKANTTAIKLDSKVSAAPHKANTTSIKIDFKVESKGANGNKPTKV